jgi:hypothetical protein
MGAIQFLKNRFGQNSDELTSYVNSEVDYEKIYRHYLTGARKLDSLYKTMDESMSVAVKNELKRDMIYEVMQTLDTIRFAERKPLQWKAENRLPNNTFFMSYLRYRGKMTSFEKELEERFRGDLRAYVTYLKEVYPSL